MKQKYNMLSVFKSEPLWIYGFVIVAWAAATLVTTGLVFKLVLHQAETAFNQRAAQLHESTERTARDNEAILEGFSAFLSAIEYADRESASRYARQILARYPHLHRLEVALSVKQEDLAKFTRRQKHTWYPEFNVKSFNFENRTWQPVIKKPIYNPIIFIEPMLPDTRQLIGADLDSTPFLRNALKQSAELQSSVASLPFKFVDGPRGYILSFPVLNSPKGEHSRRKPAWALLTVDGEAIQKEIVSLVENLEVRLYHTSYSYDDPKGLLFHIAAPEHDIFETRLFPRLTTERKLDSDGQPFALRVEKQLGWADLDLPLLITTGCISLLSLMLLLLFLTTHLHWEKQRKRSAKRLLHMATHDVLTGLPNRMLLADRFSQACSRTQRRDAPFSTMFLDLNGFKGVNDIYGHEVGDQLLKAIGALLKECIRNEDTLSRISGDEFVILLEDTPYENAEKVAKKIQDRMARPVAIKGIKLRIGLSIGIAVYPDDGTTMSELLRKADERMYEAKEHSRAMMAENA